MRHPSVLRYLNSCIAGDTAYLFVEYVSPLKKVIGEQTALELCCGLQNILIALDFIHAKVTADFYWPLIETSYSVFVHRPTSFIITCAKTQFSSQNQAIGSWASSTAPAGYKQSSIALSDSQRNPFSVDFQFRPSHHGFPGRDQINTLRQIGSPRRRGQSENCQRIGGCQGHFRLRPIGEGNDWKFSRFFSVEFSSLLRTGWFPTNAEQQPRAAWNNLGAIQARFLRSASSSGPRVPHRDHN